jgi:hypothetical protein
MGNTIINNVGGVSVSPQISQKPTAIANSPVHNVHVATTSSPAVFSANADEKQKNDADVFSQREHKSTDVSRNSFTAANGPRTPPTVSQSNPSWADLDEDEHMFNEHDEAPTDESQSEKIPTPPHSFSPTRLNIPPHPPRDEIPQTDPKGTVLIFSIDIKSPGAKFAMEISRAHNEGMLLKIIQKFSTIANETFSPTTILPGLKKHQINVFAISNEQRKEMKQQIAYKKAASAPSSAPAPPSSIVVNIPSHKFVLKFNSTTSRDLSLAYLKKIGIDAYIPGPRIIKGLVYGIPYYEQQHIDKLTQHFQTLAWYEGGAPSLRITPIEFSPIDGVTLNRSACYFSVFESEYRFCQSIPSIGNPSRPLRFEEWSSSGKKVCSFCRKFNHNYTICEERKKHTHPACWKCGAFTHQTHECTNTNKKCILCRDTKHTARTCPMYVGTYRKAGTKATNPLPVVGKAIPPHLQARVGNNSYSSIASSRPQEHQPQPHSQQQPQHHQDNNTNEEIKVLKDTITELKEMLQQQVNENKTLIQQNNTLMEKMLSQQDIMMKLVAKALNIQITEDKNNDIDIQTHTQAPHTDVLVPASPAMTASTRATPNPKPPRTPGPRPKQIDLASQQLITESMRSKTPSQTTQQNAHTPAQTPQPTNNDTQTQKPHDTDMTEGQQAFSQFMQTAASKRLTQQIPKPTPASARRLSQTLHNKPPTPPHPLINKRQRQSDSPQQS